MNTASHTPKCVMVTGASRGIGRACCDMLANLHVPTITLSRQPPKSLSATETYYKTDFENWPETERTIKKIIEIHSIDALVLNTGRGDIGSIENFSTDQIQKSLLFNLGIPLSVARLCIPTLRKRHRSNLVMIGSMSALRGERYGSLYSAAKFGLRGAAQALHYELAGANCHVGIIQPGMVRTDFFSALGFEPGPDDSNALLPEDVAMAVRELLFSASRAVVSELVLQPRSFVVKKKKHE